MVPCEAFYLLGLAQVALTWPPFLIVIFDPTKSMSKVSTFPAIRSLNCRTNLKSVDHPEVESVISLLWKWMMPASVIISGMVALPLVK